MPSLSIAVRWQENTSQKIKEKKQSATVIFNLSFSIFITWSLLTAFPGFINLYMVVNFPHLSSNDENYFIVGYRSVSESMTLGKACDRLSKLLPILKCLLMEFSVPCFSDAIFMIYLLIF